MDRVTFDDILPQVRKILSDAIGKVRRAQNTTEALQELRDGAARIAEVDGPNSLAFDLLAEAAIAAIRITPQQADDVIFLGVQDGTDRRIKERVKKTPRPKPKSEPEPEEGGVSDDEMALKFVREHGEDLRYVAQWGKWLRWDMARWRKEETLAAMDMSRRMLRKEANTIPLPRVQKALRSAATVAAVVGLARSDRYVAITADDLDKNQWLLNTPGGTVDLRTGTMRAHDRADLITKVTSVTPGGECPRFLEFLNHIMDGDQELVGFLQRMFGYALTGNTSEHALFFLYGTGSNGKSVLLSTIAHVLGDYHTTSPIEVFTEVEGNRHPTELAGLKGARLVTSIETEENRRWAEAKIKNLTGGDKISARYMRQDFFEFTPQFKLVIAGNHKPALRTVDEAIRRRFRMVPFTVTIPDHEQDKELGDKLKAEAPGILAWMIEGCLKWQAEGLDPPPAVQAATAEYLEAEDSMASWIDECCVVDPMAWKSSTDLFRSWSAFAEKAGEHVGTMRRFVQKLAVRPGLRPERNMYGRGFYGLRFKDQFNQSAPIQYAD